MDRRTLYITTPIYYVNGDPHIGHAHTTIMADILRRAWLMQGREVFLTTGTDEHGQKNQDSAEASGLPPMEYLARQSARFREVFAALLVEHDHWVRTTDERHTKVVRHVLTTLHERGLIVKKLYSGLYCVGCEMFKKESDLDPEGRCKDHLVAPRETTEENYFLRMALHQDWLRAKIEGDADWIQPEAYRREVLGMLREPLDDMCISRPRDRVWLGVPLPFDQGFVAYVWFDALINYISSLGWPLDSELFGKWWPGCVHVMGKDIIKTHCIYWPILLKALGIDPPHAFRVHGYWVGEGGTKMSKSIGNVIAPLELVETLGADSLRFFLARTMRGVDASISVGLVARAHNSLLVNSLGNLYSRVLKLYKKTFGASIASPPRVFDDDAAVRGEVLAAATGALERFDLDDIHSLAGTLVELSDRLNRYFGELEPWKLAKRPEDRERLHGLLYVLLDTLRILFELAYPILPVVSRRALENLGAAPVSSTSRRHVFEAGRLADGAPIGEDDHLFQRVEVEA